MIGHALPPALLERIVTPSEGVPLFIEEMTRSVLENADALAGTLPSLSVPETLQALLTARLDRLPAAKTVAQVGATIGREFSRSLLAAVAQVPERQLEDGLDQLVKSGLATRRTLLNDAVYTFKHALVQEAIYDSLLRRRRARLHARIVSAAEGDELLGMSEPGLLGYHSAQAGLLAKAAAYYRIAGGRSAERAAVIETRTYLERGLQFAGNLPEGPDRHRLEAELLMALARILMATKGPNDPEAAIACERAAAVCRVLGSPEMLARALYSLGIIAETRAELATAQAIGEELVTLATDSGDVGIAIAARVRLGIVAYYRGNFVTARDHLAEALALCARGRHELRDTAIAPDPHVAAAYLGVALVHLGDTAQAIAHGEAAVEGARRFGSSSPAYALALSVLPRTLEVLRDAARCGACASTLVRLCEDQGFTFLLAVGQCSLGWSAARQGDIRAGLAILTDAVAALGSSGARIRPQVGKYPACGHSGAGRTARRGARADGRGPGILRDDRRRFPRCRVASAQGRASARGRRCGSGREAVPPGHRHRAQPVGEAVRAARHDQSGAAAGGARQEHRGAGPAPPVGGLAARRRGGGRCAGRTCAAGRSGGDILPDLTAGRKL